jgi:hypothetical protein
MITEAKSEVGTNVPSTRDALVRRFNQLNQAIVAGIPETARAYDILARHLPLLREMQSLLSQRPKNATGADFTMLNRQMEKTTSFVMPVSNRAQLPTWTEWLKAYAGAIDYSVRHIRRLVMGEEQQKAVKECGWSQSDHNQLFRAATAAFDLANAIEVGPLDLLNPDWWEEHWKGMPSFHQEDLMPKGSFHVHFESEKDRDDFIKRLGHYFVGQKITPKTRTLYYPQKPEPTDADLTVKGKCFVDADFEGELTQ